MSYMVVETTLVDGARLFSLQSTKDLQNGAVVGKGDLVNIVARSKGLEIKTQGQALEDGKLNDLIQVKNIKSKKVIQAQVIGPNLVQVIF